MSPDTYLSRLIKSVEDIEDWSHLPSSPLLSVMMTTYNHEAYIRQAVASILMQQTNFDYEIVIAEDKSTDHTRDIVLEYQTRYPDKIRLRLALKNLYRQGFMPGIGARAACRGKYIALLEGDDYWTDPLKLQKQVDFLEEHPEYSMCQHRTAVKWEATTFHSRPGIPRDGVMLCEKNELTTLDILRKNDVSPGPYTRNHTSSILVRRKYFEEGSGPPEPERCSCGDVLLYLWSSLHGNIRVLDDIMSVYRVHDGGISAHRQTQMSDKANMQRYVSMYEYFRELVPADYKDECTYIINAMKSKFSLIMIKKRILRLHLELAACMWRYDIQKRYHRIALYGAGGYTRKLLASLSDKRCQLPVIIFDSNPEIESIDGIRVVPPDIKYAGAYDVIVLSTMTFAQSMSDDIMRVFGKSAPIVNLDNYASSTLYDL